MIFYQTFSLFCSAFAPATLMSVPLAADVSVPDAAFTSPSSVGGTSDPGPAPAPLLHGEGGNLTLEIKDIKNFKTSLGIFVSKLVGFNLCIPFGN